METRSHYLTHSIVPIETPLLDALYDTDNEAALDTITRDLRAEDFLRVGNPTAIPLLRRDAKSFSKADLERFTRANIKWGKMKGEPKRRKPAKKTWKKSSNKYKKHWKSSVKWVPRKKYLASKRKKKYGKRK